MIEAAYHLNFPNNVVYIFVYKNYITNSIRTRMDSLSSRGKHTAETPTHLGWEFKNNPEEYAKANIFLIADLKELDCLDFFAFTLEPNFIEPRPVNKSYYDNIKFIDDSSGGFDPGCIGYIIILAIVCTIVYYVFTIVIPFLIINLSVELLIIYFIYQQSNKYLSEKTYEEFLLNNKNKILLIGSILCFIYLVIDSDVGWLTYYIKNKFESSNGIKSAISLIIFINLISSVISFFFLINIFNKKNTRNKTYKKTINSYDEEIILNPNDYDALYKKGVYLSNSKKYNSAISCFNKAININPNKYEAWNSKGLALKNQGNIKEAEVCFEKARKIINNR